MKTRIVIKKKRKGKGERDRQREPFYSHEGGAMLPFSLLEDTST